MGVYGRAFRNVLYPLYESRLLRRKTLRYLDEYEGTQWLDPEQTRARQLQKLRAMLVHCAEHVPYYRRVFSDIRFDPRKLESLDQLAELPVLTRDLIREHHADLIDEGVDPSSLVSYGTGGSTGAPLQFRLSHDFYERRMAGQYRGYRWAGWDLGEKTLWFWGVSGRINPRPTPMGKRLKKWCYQAAWRNVVQTIYQFSESKLDRYIEFWNRWRPRTVVGYAFGLYCIACHVLDNGLSVPPCNGVILAAECTTPEQRSVMSKAFGCDVFNTYGSMEFNMIAGECDRHMGMHVNADNLIVEITEDGRPVPNGTEGEVTVTGLVHPAMPFVRYLIGDRGVLSTAECTCGRGFPLLDQVTGRTMDIVRTPEGHLVSGVWFNHTMLAIREVKRFQVVQDHVDEITMRIIPAEGYGKQVESQIERALRNALGDRIGIRFDVVDEVELSRSGKYRVIVSRAGYSHDAAQRSEVPTGAP